MNKSTFCKAYFPQSGHLFHRLTNKVTQERRVSPSCFGSMKPLNQQKRTIQMSLRSISVAQLTVKKRKKEKKQQQQQHGLDSYICAISFPVNTIIWLGRFSSLAAPLSVNPCYYSNQTQHVFSQCWTSREAMVGRRSACQLVRGRRKQVLSQRNRKKKKFLLLMQK